LSFLNYILVEQENKQLNCGQLLLNHKADDERWKIHVV